MLRILTLVMLCASCVVLVAEQAPAGTRGADVLRGGSMADRLAGGFGRDRLFGLGGADVLRGDSGGDRLAGGTGADRMNGGSGNDRLGGGPGDDRLDGGDGDDTVPETRRRSVSKGSAARRLEWVAGVSTRRRSRRRALTSSARPSAPAARSRA